MGANMEEFLKAHIDIKKAMQKARIRKYDWDKVLSQIKSINIKEKRPVVPSEVRKMAGTQYPNETYQWLERHTRTDERPKGELICARDDAGRMYFAHVEAIAELTKQKEE